MSLLEIENLNITIDTMRGTLQAIDNVSLHVDKGETLGIVGESGSGKSLTSLAVIGLLPTVAKVTADKLSFGGRDLLAMPEREKRKLRGAKISMIFQDPMTSLNPSFTVGYQLNEVMAIHQGGTRQERRKKAIELLDRVGIPHPEARLSVYPHQLSGGMCQRVMIATAIACQPDLLIADEPTTALDVTIQKQILDLLNDIQAERNMAMILITHDIGVVAQMANRIAVMYAGKIMETGAAKEVLHNPSHRYTKALLACLPSMDKNQKAKARLPSIMDSDVQF